MTKKISTFFIIFISLITLLAGCEKISDTPQSSQFILSNSMQEIQIFDYMSISLPSEYQKQESESGNIVYKKSNGSSIIISSQGIDPEHNNAETYSFYALTQYTRMFDEFSVTNESTYNLTNTNASIKEFNYKMYGTDSTLEMNCFTAFIVYGTKTYVITCSSSPENYENDKIGFSETVKSISLTEDSISAETTILSAD